jgi:hypothetical protein
MKRISFARDAHKKDGLFSVCRDCESETRAKLIGKYRETWKTKDPYKDSSPKRCYKCKRTLRRKTFSRSSNTKDGLSRCCVECSSSIAAGVFSNRRNRWAIESPYQNTELKTCAECGLRLSRKMFSTNPSSADGLKFHCKACVASLSSSRRALKLGQHVEEVDRSVVFYASDGLCHLCGLPCDPTDWHLDHIIPLSKGGAHSFRNTAPAHPSCNVAKGARDVPSVLGYTGELYSDRKETS